MLQLLIGLAIGLVLGALATWLVLRPKRQPDGHEYAENPSDNDNDESA